MLEGRELGSYWIIAAVSIWGNKKVLEIDSSDDYEGMVEHNYCQWTVHLKMVKWYYACLPH